MMLLYGDGAGFSVSDLANIGPTAALIVCGYGFLKYIKDRDDRDRTEREATLARYESLAKELKEDQRSTRLEMRSMVDGQMAVTEKAVTAITGVTHGLEELKDRFDGFEKRFEPPNKGRGNA